MTDTNIISQEDIHIISQKDISLASRRCWRFISKKLTLHENNATFVNVPLELGFNKHWEALKPYLNRPKYSYRVRGRGPRTPEKSPVPKLLWDAHSKGRTIRGAYQASLPLALSTNASIYLDDGHGEYDIPVQYLRDLIKISIESYIASHYASSSC